MIAQTLVIRYAAVSWAATLTVKVDPALKVPLKSVPVHMS